MHYRRYNKDNIFDIDSFDSNLDKRGENNNNENSFVQNDADAAGQNN